MNYILVDNDSTINIIPLKIMKKLWIPIYVYILKTISFWHTHKIKIDLGPNKKPWYKPYPS
jgi:hypothetical protein